MTTPDTFFCDSNVIPLFSPRCAAASAPANRAPTTPQVGRPEHLTPPTGTELTNAQLFIVGYLDGEQLARICGDQIRAGAAIDQLIGDTP
jgi:hypothetical protein